VSFADVLKRLRLAAEYTWNGELPNIVKVRREDLFLLLRDFDRIDRDLRNDYHSCQKLNERHNAEIRKLEGMIDFLTKTLADIDVYAPRVISFDMSNVKVAEDMCPLCSGKKKGVL